MVKHSGCVGFAWAFGWEISVLSPPWSRFLLQVMQSVKHYPFREDIAKKASSIQRKRLLSFGTCFGRFSKSEKFRLHITALPYLSPYARNRIWLKPTAEQHFLYGQHVLKSGLARISDDTPQYAGAVIMNMNDIPLVISLREISKWFRDSELPQSRPFKWKILIQWQ